MRFVSLQCFSQVTILITTKVALLNSKVQSRYKTLNILWDYLRDIKALIAIDIQFWWGPGRADHHMLLKRIIQNDWSLVKKKNKKKKQQQQKIGKPSDTDIKLATSILHKHDIYTTKSLITRLSPPV